METLRLIEMMQGNLKNNRPKQPISDPPPKELTGPKIIGLLIVIGVCIWLLIVAVLWVLSAIAFVATCPYRVGAAMVQSYQKITWSWWLMVSHRGVIAAELAVLYIGVCFAFRRRYLQLVKRTRWIIGLWLALVLALLASTQVGFTWTTAVAFVELLLLLIFSTKLNYRPLQAVTLFATYVCIMLLGVASLWF